MNVHRQRSWCIEWHPTTNLGVRGSDPFGRAIFSCTADQSSTWLHNVRAVPIMAHPGPISIRETAGRVEKSFQLRSKTALQNKRPLDQGSWVH